MKKSICLVFVFFYFSILILGQNTDFKLAKFLYDKESFSSAGSIFSNIDSEEANYYYAKCVEKTNPSSSLYFFKEFLYKFPYSIYKQNVFESIAKIYYNNLEYKNSLEYFLKINNPNDEILFKTAYSYFQLDSIDNAQLYFNNLINIKSKYKTPSYYYIAHILYTKKLYNKALNIFYDLIDNKQFSHIIPYYISQIYFNKKEYRNLIDFLEKRKDNIIPTRVNETNIMLGKSYFYLKNYDKAIYYINKSLDTNVSRHGSFLSLMLAKSFYYTQQYEEAINEFEQINSQEDSINQYASYYLGAAYLKIEKKNYALNAFKKASSYNYYLILQEDAYYNYAKISYELESSLENTLDILTNYIQMYNNFTRKEEVENLLMQALDDGSQYLSVYNKLITLENTSIEQDKILQRAAFKLGIDAFNAANYYKAIDYFNVSVNFSFNEKILYLTKYWLADCYYYIKDYQSALDIHEDIKFTNLKDLEIYIQNQKYNHAYCFFQKKNYKMAIKYFRLYVLKAKDINRLHDSYLRIADGFFMQNEFSLSENYYDKAITSNLFDVDYAIYQRSKCLSLIGKHDLKVKVLNKLIDKYSESYYYNDAILDLANYFKNISKNKESINLYSQLLMISSEEKYVAQARLGKGMALLNLGRIDSSINEFMVVTDNFQNTSYFKEALSGLRLAYIAMGDLNKYFQVLDSYKSLIAISDKDSLIYNTAFLQFIQANYSQANEAFERYIEEFNDGVFFDDALYYNGVCYLNQQDTLSAITFFNKIIDFKKSKYKQDALLFLARYHYEKRQYKISNKYYVFLENLKTNNFINRECVISLMYGFEKINTDTAFIYANRLLLFDKKDATLIAKANIIKARHQFYNGNYAKAKKTFNKIIEIKESADLAEAKYYVAYLTYLDENLLESEKLIFELIENHSNDYYIAKSYILLSDIYYDLNNRFQAKATLESVIDNYEGDQELINIAKMKLEAILKQEINGDKKYKNEEIYFDIEDVSYSEYQ